MQRWPFLDLRILGEMGQMAENDAPWFFGIPARRPNPPIFLDPKDLSLFVFALRIPFLLPIVYLDRIYISCIPIA